MLWRSFRLLRIFLTSTSLKLAPVIEALSYLASLLLKTIAFIFDPLLARPMVGNSASRSERLSVLFWVREWQW